MKLKNELMLLAAGSLLPLLVFAVIAVVALLEHERATREQEAMGRVASALSAVDAEVEGSIMTLQALAASKHLEDGNLRAFYEEAQRVLATRSNWANISLTSVDRVQLIDAVLPFGQQAPFVTDDDTFERAIATRQPAVGSVRTGPAVRQPTVRVRVPVVIGGEVKYVLTAPIKPSSFADLLRAQKLPDDWVIALADRNRRFIARIPAAPPGDPISQSFNTALETGPQGWFRGRTVEATDVFTPFATSRLSGWVLGLGIPAEQIDAPFWHTFWIATSGAVIALIAALGLAWLMARRISKPIASLARATAAMGRGVPLGAGRESNITEVNQLGDALREAGVAIRQREALAESEKAALAREREALAAADTAKDEFIAMLSHELRNPLAAMTTATHLMKSAKPGDPALAHARDVIERQVAQMARLIEDLLDMSRIATGKVNLEPTRFDLGTAVRQIVDNWRADGRFVGREIALATEPVTVLADRTRIEQILANLLDNALKFTAAGGRIEVVAAPDNGEAVLRVSDDGEGIEAGLLSRMFDLFMQSRQGLARRKGGMGIGLAIVKGLAELQGGRVSGFSEGRGRGATFVVRLPAVEAAPAPPTAIPQAPSPPPLRQRIVVIDDNDDMRESLTLALELDGQEAHGAADGTRGVELAAALQPDVVIADIGLPDFDGYEVARRVRARLGSGVLLIALTGYGQADDRSRALEAGFDAHVTKPVGPDELRAAIAAALARREREPRADPAD